MLVLRWVKTKLRPYSFISVAAPCKSKKMAKLALLIALMACVGYTQAVTHAEAIRRFNEVGITVSSSGGCSDRNNPTCTSLETARENTVANLIVLKTASGCVINVTGGTETGHASGTYSHWNGYKADISLNSCINSYVQNSFTFIGNRPGDGAPLYESAAGNIYALEGNHWDILYY